MTETETARTWAPTWSIGERIRKAREDKGWLQKDLAEHLHVARPTIAAWESNSNVPNWVTFKALAELTDTPQWWLEGSDDPRPGTVVALDRRSRHRKPSGQVITDNRWFQQLPLKAA